MGNFKEAIIQLTGKASKEVIENLTFRTDLSNQEKTIVYTYLCPEPLSDRELPNVLLAGRGNHKEGFLSENFGEIMSLLRAYRSPQYNRFILHLLHSYVQNQSSIYIVNEQDNANCSVCGKPLYAHDVWSKKCAENPSFGEQDRKEYLEYASSQSTLRICLNCALQLAGLHRLLTIVEGPGYLH